MSLLIDGLIVLALAGAVGYGLVLSRRVSRLMEILRDLEPAITAFSAAVDKSESSASGLRSAAIKLAEEVGEARSVQHHARSDAPTRAAHAVSPAASVARIGLARPRGAEKQDMVRGFFDALQARSGA